MNRIIDPRGAKDEKQVWSQLPEVFSQCRISLLLRSAAFCLARIANSLFVKGSSTQ
jgi:hypothetical protein